MNGVDQPTATAEPATERTALLTSTLAAQSQTLSTSPVIESVVQRLEAQDIRRCTSVDWCPHSFSTRGASTGFSLLVLLELRARYLNQQDVSSSDVWGYWSKEKQNAIALEDVNRHILAVWSQFLEQDLSPQDIEEALWHAFPFGNMGDTRLLRGMSYTIATGRKPTPTSVGS